MHPQRLLALQHTPRLHSQFAWHPPPKFSGQRSGLHVVDWLDMNVAYMTATGEAPQHWAACAASRLEDEALSQWLIYLKTTIGVRSTHLATWTMLCTCLEQAYGQDQRSQLAMHRLARLRQPNDVASYAREFRDLCSRIQDPEPLSETDKIHRFVSGLKDHLVARCQTRPDGRPWQSFEEVVDFTLRQDALPAPRRLPADAEPRGGKVGQQKRPVSGPLTQGQATKHQRGEENTCFVCGKPGHYARFCKMAPKNQRTAGGPSGQGGGPSGQPNGGPSRGGPSRA